MNKAQKTKIWLKQHCADHYVQQAQKMGYRSRAAYKLLEIHEKYSLIKPGMTVVDLGAAPGGWSQVARQLVGEKGSVIALDCLPMDAIENVTFIQGDFLEEGTLQMLLNSIQGRLVNIILSDMAPNISGHKSVDQPRSIYLVELALDCADKVLSPGGVFLAKVFQGSGVDELIKKVRKQFRSVKFIKPQASKAKSREVYILGIDFLKVYSEAF